MVSLWNGAHLHSFSAGNCLGHLGNVCFTTSLCRLFVVLTSPHRGKCYPSFALASPLLAWPWGCMMKQSTSIPFTSMNVALVIWAWIPPPNRDLSRMQAIWAFKMAHMWIALAELALCLAPCGVLPQWSWMKQHLQQLSGLWARIVAGKGPGFNCGNAMNRSVRSGVVIRDASPILKGELPQYLQAARMAAETYGLNVPENPVFIRWNDTPEENQMWYWNNAVNFVIYSMLAFLLLAPIFSHLVDLYGNISVWYGGQPPIPSRKVGSHHFQLWLDSTRHILDTWSRIYWTVEAFGQERSLKIISSMLQTDISIWAAFFLIHRILIRSGIALLWQLWPLV